MSIPNDGRHEGNTDCPHCGKNTEVRWKHKETYDVHVDEFADPLPIDPAYEVQEVVMEWRSAFCRHCRNLLVQERQVSLSHDTTPSGLRGYHNPVYYTVGINLTWLWRYPNYKKIELPNTPSNIRVLFERGCEHANRKYNDDALSKFRKSLEAVLKNQGFGALSNLYQMIEAFLKDEKSKQLSSLVKDSLQDIRDLGNAGSHPIADMSGDLIDIDDDSVEFFKETLIMLFADLYETPALRHQSQQPLQKLLATFKANKRNIVN